MDRDICHDIVLLKALPNLTLNTSNDEALSYLIKALLQKKIRNSIDHIGMK